MKIWYFHHYATPYEVPGLHRPFEFGTYFEKNGHQTAVFTSSYLHYSGDNMIEDHAKRVIKKYDGVDAVYIRTCGYQNSKINRVINMVQFAGRLFSAGKWYGKEHWKPDVIVASSPHPLTMLAGLQMAKKLHIPCVCEVRDFWPEVFFMGGVLKEHGLIGRMLLRGERYIYEKADRLVFLKEGDHTYISDHGWDTEHGGKIDLKKCKYINNGVDLQLFEQRAASCTDSSILPDEKEFNVIYCGTIRPVNHLDMLLDVAKLVSSDIKFEIYGTGNCVEELQKRIAEEHIGNVRLRGYVENKYVPGILKRASVNILNYSGTKYNWSRGNSSNKLFEYLASGKPVVSTVKMGYDILSGYHCGMSAEHCTAEETASAIQRIHDLPKEQYQELCANAKHAAQDFNIPNLAKKYIEVLQEAVSDDRK